jgi:hypothetical protein
MPVVVSLLIQQRCPQIGHLKLATPLLLLGPLAIAPASGKRTHGEHVLVTPHSVEEGLCSKGHLDVPEGWHQALGALNQGQ